MRGLEKNCTRWRRQTDTQTEPQTDGHGDSMTNSAQWGRVGENQEKSNDLMYTGCSIVYIGQGPGVFIWPF